MHLLLTAEVESSADTLRIDRSGTDFTFVLEVQRDSGELVISASNGQSHLKLVDEGLQDCLDRAATRLRTVGCREVQAAELRREILNFAFEVITNLDSWDGAATGHLLAEASRGVGNWQRSRSDNRRAAPDDERLVAETLRRRGLRKNEFEEFWRDVLALAPEGSVGEQIVRSVGAAWGELYERRETLAVEQNWSPKTAAAVSATFADCANQGHLAWARVGIKRLYDGGLQALLAAYLQRPAAQ